MTSGWRFVTTLNFLDFDEHSQLLPWHNCRPPQLFQHLKKPFLCNLLRLYHDCKFKLIINLCFIKACAKKEERERLFVMKIFVRDIKSYYSQQNIDYALIKICGTSVWDATKVLHCLRVPKVVKSCTIALYSDKIIRRQFTAIKKTTYCQKTTKICCDSKQVSRNFSWIIYSNRNFVLMVMCFRYLPQSFARCSNVKRSNVQLRTFCVKLYKLWVNENFRKTSSCRADGLLPCATFHVHTRN